MVAVLHETTPARGGDPVETAARAWVAKVPALPMPGGGDTLGRWQALAHMAAQDLCLVKVLEAHYDARAILLALAPERLPPAQALGAVWAAHGPQETLQLDPCGRTLSGSKPWCSGAGWVDMALVTVREEERTRLFLVDARHSGVQFDTAGWVATGMARIPSGTAHFNQVPAVEIGASNAYLERPGFWHGGAGIAACWYGAAVALAEPLRRAERCAQPGVASGLLGEVDMQLASCAALLRELAAQIDADPHTSHRMAVVRVRSVVERACMHTLDLVGRALGPGPMCLDTFHAQRWSDLTVFIRQSHADRDWQELGALCHAEEHPWRL